MAETVAPGIEAVGPKNGTTRQCMVLSTAELSAGADNLHLSRYLRFLVFDNRHCAHICIICRKCQFEVKERAERIVPSVKGSGVLRTCIANKQTLP